MEEKSMRGPRIELVGNRSVIIDGCDGIIDYDENKVAVRLGRITANITGHSMRLRVLTENTAIIDGYIHAVEYT
ncbi:YabP/YqfC family sporulation protein [Scatolibacter rhodanostii]|uniref:YabP/YqfC family sporulation protein n=1 Tax=Scatolibacter rhodanostii TaxID=2014781 RepID=UPI000C07B07F|nr:YabP/YqfC family sporulation protein [Scatolibacter rhodanostii]